MSKCPSILQEQFQYDESEIKPSQNEPHFLYTNKQRNYLTYSILKKGGKVSGDAECGNDKKEDGTVTACWMEPSIKGPRKKYILYSKVTCHTVMQNFKEIISKLLNLLRKPIMQKDRE